MPKNSVVKPFFVSIKVCYRKFIMHRRGRHQVSAEKSFVSQDQNEKIGKGILLFFRIVLLAENLFGDRAIKILPRFFFVRMPKTFAGEHFFASIKLWHRRIPCIKERRHHIFFETFFSSQDRKTSWGFPSVLQNFSGLDKNLWIRDGGYLVFSVKVFCLTVSENFVGYPSMFHKISSFENFYA